MSAERKNPVAVAMSGGVDSSVVAGLIRDQGYDVVGLFMRRAVCVGWDAGADEARLAAEQRDAENVAETLGIDFEALDFEEEFRTVTRYFLDEYNRGRTPNPCAFCNSRLKFGKLLEYCEKIGAEKLATGHHAQIVPAGRGRYLLKKGRDRDKDQSYMLFGINRGDLGRILFPLGAMTKAEVRSTAERLGLALKDKPESQDICFVPGGDYRVVLKEMDPGCDGPGKIVDEAGRVLGEHEGCRHYTIGQRRGLKIAMGLPVYVVGIRPEANEVIIGPVESLLRKSMYVEDVNWLVDLEPDAAVSAAVRYGQRPRRADIRQEGTAWKVDFRRSVRAITPGQAAVFYDGETVLGGGWISSNLPER